MNLPSAPRKISVDVEIKEIEPTDLENQANVDLKNKKAKKFRASNFESLAHHKP